MRSCSTQLLLHFTTPPYLYSTLSLLHPVPAPHCLCYKLPLLHPAHASPCSYFTLPT
jgi:hypothetical protein